MENICSGWLTCLRRHSHKYISDSVQSRISYSSFEFREIWSRWDLFSIWLWTNFQFKLVNNQKASLSLRSYSSELENNQKFSSVKVRKSPWSFFFGPWKKNLCGNSTFWATFREEGVFLSIIWRSNWEPSFIPETPRIPCGNIAPPERLKGGTVSLNPKVSRWKRLSLTIASKTNRKTENTVGENIGLVLSSVPKRFMYFIHVFFIHACYQCTFFPCILSMHILFMYLINVIFIHVIH